MYVLIAHNMKLKELIDHHLCGYAHDLAEYFLNKGLENLLCRYIINYYRGQAPTIDDIMECLNDSSIDDVIDFAFKGRIRR